MITLPASIQDLVGRTIQRIFTSSELDQIVFDISTSSASPQSRYSFEITGAIYRIQNLSNMVGYLVSEVRALPDELNGLSKMAIFTNNGTRFGVIYFWPELEEQSFITEDEDDLVQEDDEECSCLLLETSEELEEAELTEINLGSNPPFNSNIQYVVQEDDVVFESAYTDEDECACDEE